MNQRSQFLDTLVFCILQNRKKRAKQSTFVIVDIDVHTKLLMVNQRSKFVDTLVFCILRNQKKGSKQRTFVFIGIDIHAKLLDKVNAHVHHKKHVHCWVPG